MDAMSAWEANANAKSLLTKLGITDFTAIVGNLSGGQKNVLRWRSVLLKHRIY